MAAAWTQELELLMPLPVIAVASLAVRRRAVRPLVYGLLGLGLGLQLAAGAASFALARDARERGLGLGLAVPAALAAACLWPALQRLLARWMPIEVMNPLHTLALCGTVDLVGIVAFQQLSYDVVGTVAAGSPLTPLDVALSELPFLMAALLGAGLITRRTASEVAARLGWVRPAWWQVALGLAAAGLFLGLSQATEAAAQHLTPDAANRVNAASGRLYGGLLNPVGIAAIAILPGLCEEALFRGAMQPRLGLAWTAVVFAAVHTQYGLTLDAGLILLLGAALGLLRRYANTTTSTITHVVYNGLAGVALAPVLLVPGLVVEALLISGLVALLVSRRIHAPVAVPR